MSKQKQLKVTLVKSPLGCLRAHRASVKGLGLRRMHHSVVVNDDACVRGMINQVSYLLKVEEA